MVGRSCVEGRPRAPARSVWRQADGMALGKAGGAAPGYPWESTVEADDRPLRAEETNTNPRSARGVTANVTHRRK